MMEIETLSRDEKYNNLGTGECIQAQEQVNGGILLWQKKMWYNEDIGGAKGK